MKKILVLDNYDSFTYNLVHYIEEITGQCPDVFRNDQINIEDINQYDKILLSPGPGVPEESGILKELINMYGPTKSIFGVCLGMQAITEVYGGKLKNLANVYHGVATQANILKQDIIFEGIPKEIEVGRYHSWAASRKNFPKTLEVTCEDQSGEIMALRHKKYDVRGVQFHPESVLTQHGKQIITNWINN